MRRWKVWVAIGVVALGVALVGGPYVYIHFIEGEAPAPLELSSPSATSSSGEATGAGSESGETDGTWTVSTGSLVGYRVTEKLFGQSNEAVGRTGDVTGSITISGTTITAGDFTVDMTTVQSDQSRRDSQFNGAVVFTSRTFGPSYTT